MERFGSREEQFKSTETIDALINRDLLYERKELMQAGGMLLKKKLPMTLSHGKLFHCQSGAAVDNSKLQVP
jgi:hypothetical protein